MVLSILSSVTLNPWCVCIWNITCSSDYALSEKGIIQGKKEYSKHYRRQNGLHRTRSVELTSSVGKKTIDKRFENQDSGRTDSNECFEVDVGYHRIIYVGKGL